MKKNLFKRGFTLIELLVVIAIIGILASVVLASLNSARDKGSDAAIKSSINNMRAQAELFYDGVPGNYGEESDSCTKVGSLFADPTITKGVDAAAKASGNAAVCTSSDSDNTNSTGDATSWAIAVPLKTTPTVYYCVDSTGSAGTSSSPTLAAGTAGAAVCP